MFSTTTIASFTRMPMEKIKASSHDPLLVAVLTRWDATWSKAWKSSVGVAVLGLSNDQTVTTASIADMNSATLERCSLVRL